MKKAIYKSDWGAHFGAKDDISLLLGFDPGYLWKSVSLFCGPHDYGRYLVIKKDGRVSEMYCTGSRFGTSRRLFEEAAFHGPLNEAYLDDVHMTDSDLMELYRNPFFRWYEVHDWREYEDWHEDIHVYTDKSEDYPLYFLDLNLDEKIELDEKGEIKDCDGTTMFSMDENGDYVRATTDSKEEEE